MSSVLDEVFEKLDTLPELASALPAAEPSVLLALDVG